MRLGKWLLFVVILAGCGSAPPAASPRATPDPSTGLILPAGYSAAIVATGLNQPTHIAVGPDGALYLTQLNGGENDGTGQVVRITKPGAAPEVVLDGLTKPTGLTWAGTELYIVAGNNVLESHVDSTGKFSSLVVAFANLPFNGRSEGQISTGPDGNLFFQSTGNETMPLASGFIYSARPGGGTKEIFARGLKNAYAMIWDKPTGRMYATEIGDGAIPGIGQPPEELNLVRRGGNYGWPYCYADQLENPAWHGTRDYCADTDVPLATFPPDSTPTGLAIYDRQLIAALWNGSPPRLMRVDMSSGQVAEFAAGFKRPIALLTVESDGSFDGLLVVDMDAGTVWRLLQTPPK
ncbi:MAG TPA: PQQ-dependent sugar dehydrogenase [Aggregatilineaceae bacterium]|nr:PQQ-dependent sugar dehydrogenase [Aggregatilineaceae bacterium]